MRASAVVTGSTGFVGRACLTPMTKKYSVLALCRKIPENKIPNVDYHQVDLEDRVSVSKFFRNYRPSHLVHTAWARAGAGGLWNSPENEHWVDVSEFLVKCFVDAGGKRAVVCGTCAEYAFSDTPLKENESVLAPKSIYGLSKVELHRKLSDLSAKSDFYLVWPRLFFLYGPGENKQRLVPSIIRGLLNGQPTPCTHGKQIRDYAFVGDIADGLTRLLGSSFEGAVNLASGTGIQLRDLIHKIGVLLGREELIELGALPSRAGEPEFIVADTNNLEQILGWSPSTDILSGLKTMIEFEKQQLRMEGFNEHN